MSTIITIAVFAIKVKNQDGSITYEQILTLALLSAALFQISPLFYFAIICHSYILRMIDISLISISCCFVVFFILTTAFGLRSFNILPLLVGIVAGLIAFLQNYYKNASVYLFISIGFYSLLAIPVIVSSCIALRSEKSYFHKLYMYLFSNLVTLVCFVVIQTLYFCPAVSSTPVAASLNIVLYFTYSIMMTYFHWPFESDIDLEYLEPGKGDQEGFQADIDDMPNEIKAEGSDVLDTNT
ncbi:hypothetical protein TVAG_290060 [Trichomonas vaginalis G3]|uniref:Uncharacterized protein n=1 Tax=Trichomonas vaginalis (strain ATCC PRA-98 / G3) TaxID=412133 RepID=A2H7E0_TRIV3|nr:hypothetical protein TVAGG3_0899340 [Trichomonas vaginalis G3]EAX74677.1 hypothetical protein TVAG_290060 [Trichomonas vaginalis G3]KAI5483574.1 hypothetical protein TVAGG3_0899340 [Trichomonas vaginalis G3]|eukprot:XP_001287607.1 hypothetical protein [Trichomonas vaginalis G3]